MCTPYLAVYGKSATYLFRHYVPKLFATLKINLGIPKLYINSKNKSRKICFLYQIFALTIYYEQARLGNRIVMIKLFHFGNVLNSRRGYEETD